MLPNLITHYLIRGVSRRRNVGIRFLSLSPSRHYFEEKYSTEECHKILKVLNEINAGHDLRKYIISSKRVNELLRLRNEKGEFTHLDDLIPIMGIKVLEKFYGSMLDKRSLGLGNPMVPGLSPEQITSNTRVLSVHIIGNRVSWSLIRKLPGDSVLLEALDVQDVDLVPKAHFLNVLRQMSELGRNLPSCDLCICEEFPSQVPSAYMFNFYLQMTQARSMLLGCLAANPNPPQIISMKAIAVAKLFSTYVGSEKVSGQYVVEALFEGSFSATSPLEMDPMLCDYYLNAGSETKEHLSNVFLLNLAYWKLTNQFSK